MAFCNDEYFEKIGHIQKNMHEMEKRRLELERELFSYCRSDQRITQLKYAKLQRYLKEVSVKEEQAKARNRELLRSVEAVVSQADRLWPDCSSLHQMKKECWNQISKLREKQEKQRAVLRNKSKDLPSSSAQAAALPQPCVSFTGRQAIRDPCADPGTSVLSPRPSHSAPNQRLQPLLPSGLLKDGCVSKASAGPALSDDIPDSIQRPRGAAGGAGHERRALGEPSDCRSAARPAEAPAEPSPRVTLTRPQSISPSPLPQTPERSFSPLSSLHPNSSHDASEAPSPPQRGSGDGPLRSLHEFVEDLETAPEQELKSRSPSLPSSSVEISAESSVKIDSDLSVSTSDCDLQRSVNTAVSRLRCSEETSALPKDKTPAEVPQTTVEDSSDCLSSSSATDRLSLDGLSHLLDHIEGHLQGSAKELYHDLAVSQQTLSDLISLCEGKAALNGQALQACAAVAVQQLQMLSWSTSKGCLLPWELVRANWDCAERTRIRSLLPADSVPLWDRWLRHALMLREQGVLSREDVLHVFTPALLQRSATYTHQAEVLLRALLNDAPPDLVSTPTDRQDSSSASLPSSLGDGVDILPVRSSLQGPLGAARPGVQSGGEDSADQGSVESIPIRETKAYQLLKQSASQDRHWGHSANKDELGEEEEEEEEDEGSGPKPPGSLTASKHSRWEGGRSSADRDASFRKVKTKAEALSAVQSKAFWGESDDSNSDIEIALRPQSWKSGDDTDDFYD